MAISTLEELSEHITLTEDEKNWDKNGDNTLPLFISDHIIPLLSNPSIRRQFVPSIKENEDNAALHKFGRNIFLGIRKYIYYLGEYG